jgi:hypothetical protein
MNRLYELVLREGTLDDIQTLVDGVELVRLCDTMWLPAHIRAAWQPLIDAARATPEGSRPDTSQLLPPPARFGRRPECGEVCGRLSRCQYGATASGGI